MRGRKLLIIEPLKVVYDEPKLVANSNGPNVGSGRFEVTGRAIVALDMIGAGEGQLVLVTQGSSARLAQDCGKLPTDAVVIGIVDEAMVMGQRIN
jgi:ethanolamine utilization protein EutN